jgi:hypothetical protein
MNAGELQQRDVLMPVTMPAGVTVARGDLAGLDTLSAEAIAVFVFDDVRPLCGVAGFLDWRLCGELSDALAAELHRGDVGEVMLLPATGRIGRRRLFVFGLGPMAACGHEALRTAARRALDVMHRAGVKSAALAAPQNPSGDFEDAFVSAASAELAVDDGFVRAILVEHTPKR